MLHILKSSIFDSPAQTLVNTVNTVGVMGKGVAKGFKTRYPKMFREYKFLCDQHVLQVGTLHCWHGPGRWVLNFPTKTTWKKPSKLSYIEAGLQVFSANYRKLGIQSISFPPLGCGNGQLDWLEVRPLMLKYLWDLDIPIFIHERFDHVDLAEQDDPEARVAPVSYAEFLTDLHAIVDEHNGQFQTLSNRAPYRASIDADNDFAIYLDRKFTIGHEFVESAWPTLQTGILTPDSLGGHIDKQARYLFPIISALPYVRTVKAQLHVKRPNSESFALFFNEATSGYDKFQVDSRRDDHGCLFH